MKRALSLLGLLALVSATPLWAGEHFASVNAAQLRMEWGTVAQLPRSQLALRAAGIRALVGDRPRAAVDIAFTYRGPSRDVAPLASGELRRQIGLKLRARDTCNLVYVMWHIAPTTGIHVAIKANPGQHTHEECGDRGYVNVAPERTGPVAAIRPGERHQLGARITGNRLRVSVDGAVAWEGALPPLAFSFDGPVGIRSDNGEFDIELRVLNED
jgi:hypothetical protein